MSRPIQKLTALIVGSGSIGSRHAKNLHTLGVRTIVYLRHKAHGKQLPSGHVAHLSEALAAKPDFAVIANPTSAHIPVARSLAKAGVHLFIEKPLAADMKGVAALLATAQANRLVTMVGYNFRFHPQLQKIRQLIAAGAIGTVVSGRVQCGQYLPDWHPGEDYTKGYAARRALGGGVILTLIHEIDYLSWLLGKPKLVFSMNGQLSHLRLDVEDTAEILIRYASGAIGEVHIDYVQRTPSRNMQIIGDQGTIVWDFFSGELKVFRVKTNSWRSYGLPKGFERNHMFLDEMKHFLACLAEREQTAIPLRAGVDGLRVALAAKRSGRTGKAVPLN